jgi:hypothetical protein
MNDLSKLIEKQIEEMADALRQARKFHTLDEGAKRTVAALLLMSGRLLEIVQNQQTQIEELQKRVGPYVDNDSECKCGHSRFIHTDTGCKCLGCSCRQFRLEAKR